VGHALKFATRTRATQIVVVGGFGFPAVEQELARLRKVLVGLPSVTLVENQDFRGGNLLSFQAARPHVGGDFLLMNVDHIYRPAIAERAAAPASWVTGFIDTDRKLGADDMKVRRDAQGRITAIAKTLNDFDAGYVGMTRVPTAALDHYLSQVDEALAEDGRDIHVERVLARMARTQSPAHVRDISGFGWLEVDTPDERTHAAEALRDGTWL
jgi:choline kinase